MICCGVDCGPCSDTPCRRQMLVESERCPAECSPLLSIDKGVCNGCKTFRPNRLSKKQERRAKVEERKRAKYA
jgi:hypothetical protein